MGRIVTLLVCAAGLVGLTAGGFAEPADQDAKKAVQPPPKAAVKAAPIANPANAAAIDANVQVYEQSYGPGFRQLFRAEMHYVRVVAQPTKAQFDQIAAEGDAVVKATIRSCVEAMMTPMVPGGRNAQADARTQMTDAIARLVRTNLSAEQADQYQKEVDQRNVAQRQAIRAQLIAKVDKLVLLTPEQRTKLGEILDQNWDSSWEHGQWLRYLDQYQFFPPMPDAKITPILTQSQQAVWASLSKQNVRFGIDFGMLQDLQVADEVWDDPPKASPKPAGKDKGVSKGGGKR